MVILHSSFKNLSAQFYVHTRLSVSFNLQHIPQYAVGTKTISVNSEKWKLPSNITEFSSKLPIMYFFPSVSFACGEIRNHWYLVKASQTLLN